MLDFDFTSSKSTYSETMFDCPLLAIHGAIAAKAYHYHPVKPQETIGDRVTISWEDGVVLEGEVHTNMVSMWSRFETAIFTIEPPYNEEDDPLALAVVCRLFASIFQNKCFGVICKNPRIDPTDIDSNFFYGCKGLSCTSISTNGKPAPPQVVRSIEESAAARDLYKEWYQVMEVSIVTMPCRLLQGNLTMSHFSKSLRLEDRVLIFTRLVSQPSLWKGYPLEYQDKISHHIEDCVTISLP